MFVLKEFTEVMGWSFASYLFMVWIFNYFHSRSNNSKVKVVELSGLNILTWVFYVLSTVAITLFLVGGLLRTDVLVDYDLSQAGEVMDDSYFNSEWPETWSSTISAEDFYFQNKDAIQSEEWTNVSIIVADGKYFNRSSSPLYLLLMYVLFSAPILYIWVKRIKPSTLSSWSTFLNKAILFFLTISFLGATILLVFADIFYETITNEDGQRVFAQSIPMPDGWEEPVMHSMIGYYILPILLIVARIVMYIIPEEKIAMQKAKKEDNNTRAAAIENIKRAKELKELGVISEDEFEEILRKHKGDATKGL